MPFITVRHKFLEGIFPSWPKKTSLLYETQAHSIRIENSCKSDINFWNSELTNGRVDEF